MKFEMGDSVCLAFFFYALNSWLMKCFGRGATDAGPVNVCVCVCVCVQDDPDLGLAMAPGSSSGSSFGFGFGSGSSSGSNSGCGRYCLCHLKSSQIHEG